MSLQEMKKDARAYLDKIVLRHLVFETYSICLVDLDQRRNDVFNLCVKSDNFVVSQDD